MRTRHSPATASCILKSSGLTCREEPGWLSAHSSTRGKSTPATCQAGTNPQIIHLNPSAGLLHNLSGHVTVGARFRAAWEIGCGEPRLAETVTLARHIPSISKLT